MKAQNDDVIRLKIKGEGAEIVIGVLEEKHVESLQKISQDGQFPIDQFEDAVGCPWSEFDNIWHYYGPFHCAQYADSNGESALEPEVQMEIIDCWEDSNTQIKNCVKPISESYPWFWSKLQELGKYIIFVESIESGEWGEIEIPSEIFKQKSSYEDFFIVEYGYSFSFETPQGDLDLELTLAQALYLKKDGSGEEIILKWNEYEETVGKSIRICVIDTQGEIILQNA